MSGMGNSGAPRLAVSIGTIVSLISAVRSVEGRKILRTVTDVSKHNTASSHPAVMSSSCPCCPCSRIGAAFMVAAILHCEAAH